MGNTMTTITVEISEHDGMFYATSDEIPGFLLVSKEKQALDADILPALKQLMAIKEKFAKPTFMKKRLAENLVERREFAFA